MSSNGASPLISVVTVCFNSEKTIARTIQSVRTQSFGRFEHLLIDGLSKDHTLAIARAHGDERLVIVSERDRGIYDAMNKGLARARGEFLVFLNSDDRFSDHTSLDAIARSLLEHDADVAFGDVRFVTSGGISTRIWRPGRYRKRAISLGWTPPHPSFTARTSLLRESGGFELAYTIAADFDLMLRVLRATDPRRVRYVARELVVMQQGGESTASLGQMWRGLSQCAHAMQTNGVPLWRLAAVLKPTRALGQVASAVVGPARAHAASYIARKLRRERTEGT